MWIALNPAAHSAAQAIVLGETSKISQSEHTCASPSGSEKPETSMCTSEGLTICPSVTGSMIVGVFGGLAEVDAVSNSDARIAECR
jgi:hypothetical protein